MQPPEQATDHFTVLGLPTQYAIDLVAAEAAFKRLSRQMHPDRFATGDPRARRASLARTVQLNEAWRTLKDPVRRAEYLLRRAGVEVAGGQSEQKQGDNKTATAGEAPGEAPGEALSVRKIAVPPAFLLEILELRDELGEAQRRGDLGQVALMNTEMRARVAASMDTIAVGLGAGTPEQLDRAAQALVALRYFQRFLDEVARHTESKLEDASHG